ncbi:hypothetical protein Tco_1183048 [Tanacetum coccineum]
MNPDDFALFSQWKMQQQQQNQNESQPRSSQQSFHLVDETEDDEEEEPVFEAYSNMVQSMWLVNNENNEDAWQWPQHEMADLVSDKRLMNEEAAKPLQKRWNSSLIGQWELGRQPLFFKETDPQPRKHTLWQATTDFTNGEASTYRQHYLQCAQGLLNKHYEKLIQCDTRLRFLSQQLDPVLDLPFASKASVEDQNLSGTSQRSYASASQTSSLQAPKVNANGLVHEDYMEEYGYAESSSLVRPKTMSISDLVNHIGHCISEKKSDQVLPFFENVSSGVDQNDMLQNISQILLNDTYLTTASEEENLMSRVNSLCAGNDYMNIDDGKNQNDAHYGNGYSEDCNPVPEIAMDQGWEGDFGMSRNDSFNDLLHHLPRIASLPRIFFDI